MQDLAYYESPPGLQLLHCVTFDDAIKGGESTLLDTFPLVQAVQEVRGEGRGGGKPLCESATHFECFAPHTHTFTHSLTHTLFLLPVCPAQREPEVFDALSTIPASFQKAHLRRAHPAQYLSRKPHVQTSTDGDVIGVSWAPAFEGPVQGSAEVCVCARLSAPGRRTPAPLPSPRACDRPSSGTTRPTAACLSCLRAAGTRET